MFSLISGFFSNSKILLGSLVVIVFLIQVAYIRYITNSLEQEEKNNQKLEMDIKAKVSEYESLQVALNTAVIEYEKQLDFEGSKAVFETNTLKDKELVTKTSVKVKEQVMKRGEIKNEKNSNFTITSF